LREPSEQKLTPLPIMTRATCMCKSLDLIHRSMSDFAVHRTAAIIGEAGSILVSPLQLAK
jgi:hypothetical protein